ncbi:hypothetical protein BJ980_002058 [Nocardioides daedukensis]|uniref:Uncharacterized protein n=1 Tax=Nocardioides daedukensis TaxID=634462 RepID=A0A7Y9S493_9ACTN|nr:hypothetical protein [Nocardioides daedukensis]NYG59135.1 hypothetical protein [Nocardioides daedukensis]
MTDQEENPVTNGLVALVTVAIVVGLLAGIAVLFATNLLGVGDSSGSSAEGTGGETLFMPEPVETTSNGGPLVTLLSPSPSKKSSKSSKKSSPSASESESEKPEITLSQGAFEVEAGGQLYLSGVYPTGEGAVLDIEQRVGTGAWEEFPVDVNVSGGTFSVYVNTSATGDIQWRMVDKSRKVTSNVVKVKHG